MKHSRMTAAASVALCCAMLWTPSLCYKHFQERIPNGRNVEHSCRPNHLWYGVGHQSWQGGGGLSAFGVDFKKMNFTWNECLCRQDSDGDGLTNGEELGDPDCTWKPGQATDRIKDITNPGVCEPLDNPTCSEANNFDVCAAVEFECPSIHSPDVRSMDMRYPTHPVPINPSKSEWVCMTFDLPDTDAHVIAWEPIIGNQEALHHLQVFGCTDDDEDYKEIPGTCYELLKMYINPPSNINISHGQAVTTRNSPIKTSTFYQYRTIYYILPTPQECNWMRDMTCTRLMLMWNLGVVGNCYGDGYGMRIGSQGITRFVFQLRLDNPEHLSGLTDSSGIKFYYTETLRPNDMGMMLLGQGHLNIPPGQAAHVEQGTCGSKCTEDLHRPIYIVEAFLHMLYLGTAGSLKIMRDGREIETVLDAQQFDYDEPTTNQFGRRPVQVLPGDELVTTCVYDSRHMDKYTYRGEVDGEMCYSFITFFPADSGMLRWCPSNGPEYKGCSAYPQTNYGNCDVDVYLQSSDLTNAMMSLQQACTQDECLPGCGAAIEDVRQHPCLGDEVLSFVLREIRLEKGEEFANLLRSCDSESGVYPSRPPAAGDNDSSMKKCPWNNGALGQRAVAWQMVLLQVCCVVVVNLLGRRQ